MKIEMGKKYRTRDGLDVEIISTSGREPFVVVGYLGIDDQPCTWRADGRFSKEEKCSTDLVEVREPREWIVYVHKDNSIVCTIGMAYADGEWPKAIRVREVLEDEP